MRLSQKTLDRLKAVDSDLEVCIIWKGSTDRDGYGLATVLDPKRTRGAHRVALALDQGVDVDEFKGLLVLHRCDTPDCVNPRHLWTGTQSDNMRDMLSKGRQAVRTKCLKGHDLTNDNVYVDKRTGRRRCAICHRKRQAKYDRKK